MRLATKPGVSALCAKTAAFFMWLFAAIAAAIIGYFLYLYFFRFVSFERKLFTMAMLADLILLFLVALLYRVKSFFHARTGYRVTKERRDLFCFTGHIGLAQEKAIVKDLKVRKRGWTAKKRKDRSGAVVLFVGSPDAMSDV